MRKLPWRVERIGQIWKRYADKLAPLCSATFPDDDDDDDDSDSDSDSDSVGTLAAPLFMLRHDRAEPGWIPWFIDIYTARPGREFL